MCIYSRDLGSRPDVGLRFEIHRVCAHMVPRSIPTRSRFQLGPGFGLVIDSASVPRLEVIRCASNHIYASSKCHRTFPEIRESHQQMGSGLVVTKWVLVNNTHKKGGKSDFRCYDVGHQPGYVPHFVRRRCDKTSMSWRSARLLFPPSPHPSSRVVTLCTGSRNFFQFVRRKFGN